VLTQSVAIATGGADSIGGDRGFADCEIDGATEFASTVGS